MKQLGNVRAIFKIDRNLDYHLRLDDEAALEAKVRHLKFCGYKPSMPLIFSKDGTLSS